MLTTFQFDEIVPDIDILTDAHSYFVGLIHLKCPWAYLIFVISFTQAFLCG